MKFLNDCKLINKRLSVNDVDILLKKMLTNT